MKSAVLYTLIAVLSFSGLNAYAQGTCHAGGGQYPGVGTGVGTTSPYPSNPSAADVSAFLSQGSAAAVSPKAAPQTAPQARITVVDPVAANASGSVGTASATSAARITVVSEGSVSDVKPAVVDDATGVSNDTASLDAALKGLVGTWTAVARQGDGELTTVELQLDDRGWAKLTVPGTDGTRSTIKRRVEFNNEEIKLTGPDAELLLGKLVSFNSRQMVLERAGGQVTFVRP